MDWLDRLHKRSDLSPSALSAAEETTREGGEESIWRPDPAQVAVMAEMRRRELLGISKRLGRVDKKPRGRLYEVIAILFAGGLLGGAFGLLPFLAQKPSPSVVDKLIYFGLLGFAAAIAFVCWRASKDTDAERTDTVVAIKEDLDQLLEGSLIQQ
jgi:hypothetical protein